MGTIQGLTALVGRLFLVAIFLMSALANKIPQFSQVAESMKNEGVPEPKIMLVGAIAFLLAGGVSVLIGYRARLGAALLLIFLILATYFYHDFWNITDEAKKQMEMGSFVKNVALMGAMLFIIANGAGAWSMDQCCSASKPETTSE